MTSFRNFLITFLISALLFGVVGYFTTVFVSGVVNGLMDSDGGRNEQADGTPQNSDQSGNERHEKEPEGNSYSFLLVLTDYDPVSHNDYTPTEWEINNMISSLDQDEGSLGLLARNSRHVHATAIVLVKADKENREYLLCYLSPETRVYTPSGAVSLGNLYGSYGINSLKEYVKSLTGIRVDYHFILDGFRMYEVVKEFSKYSLEVPVEIYSYGDYFMTSYNFSEAEKKAAFDPEPAETEEETGDYVEEVTPPPVLDRAMYAGTYELERDVLEIVSELKECCLEDVEMKGKFVLDAVEFFLRDLSDMSESTVVSKIAALTESTPFASDDPLEMKPALASDFTSSDVASVYQMMDAIDYFDVTPMIYPGNYISTHDAQIGYYVPTLRTATEDLLKYR